MPLSPFFLLALLYKGKIISWKLIKFLLYLLCKTIRNVFSRLQEKLKCKLFFRCQPWWRPLLTFVENKILAPPFLKTQRALIMAGWSSLRALRTVFFTSFLLFFFYLSLLFLYFFFCSTNSWEYWGTRQLRNSCESFCMSGIFSKLSTSS